MKPKFKPISKEEYDYIVRESHMRIELLNEPYARCIRKNRHPLLIVDTIHGYQYYKQIN